MKKIYILSVAMLLLIISACKSDKKQENEPEVKTVETTQEKSKETATSIDASFSDAEIGDVFKQYVQLKTALVNTDAKQASVEASNLLTAMSNNDADQEAMKAAQNIVESDDVEEQRAAFVVVTTAVEAMLEGAIESGVVYKQYCPMAFNNTGAYWLSESKEIRNPYFGDKMLKCGRIDARIE